jgi:hypothetical protein
VGLQPYRLENVLANMALMVRAAPDGGGSRAPSRASAPVAGYCAGRAGLIAERRSGLGLAGSAVRPCSRDSGEHIGGRSAFQEDRTRVRTSRLSRCG